MIRGSGGCGAVGWNANGSKPACWGARFAVPGPMGDVPARMHHGGDRRVTRRARVAASARGRNAHGARSIARRERRLRNEGGCESSSLGKAATRIE